jgi:hypothetical protein
MAARGIGRNPIAAKVTVGQKQAPGYVAILRQKNRQRICPMGFSSGKKIGKNS